MSNPSEPMPIAVIGLSYRAPGIGRKGLWEYLSQARSAWTHLTESQKRFDATAYQKKGGDKSGTFRAQGAHFLPEDEDVFAFDAAFFNMREMEAKSSDPQHRMLLECALEAAEDAGHSLLDLAGKKIGVFIGSGQHEYAQRLSDDYYGVSTYTGTGIAPCMAANRISYFFDVDGPSITLDAACASSVYAAHQAVSAIRNGECEGAFVGASSLNTQPGAFLALEKTGALSEKGRCYPYDTKAAGFGRGEGAGLVLIKPLDAALRDGDPIRALIKNTACNHCGRSEGITMPSQKAQMKLLQFVHEQAGLDPRETAVVEGHGTGTGAGDPVEAGAFTQVLARDRTPENPLYLGSVKSNFGHLEGASGMLGIIKAIYMLERETVLPTAGFENINTNISGYEKLAVLSKSAPWPENERKRVVVTNFGFGGSNSAIILEKAGEDQNFSNGNGGSSGNGHANGRANGHANGHSKGHANGNGHVNGNGKASNGVHATGHSIEGASDPDNKVFVFSARTQKCLEEYLNNFDEYLDEADASAHFLNDLSYTLGTRRTHFNNRVAVRAASIEELQDGIVDAKISRAKESTVAFVFTGQGAQYPQMAAGLKQYEVATQALEEADSYLRSMGARWSLREELSKPEGESRINEAEFSQPACTALQIAILAVLNAWKIVPSAVTGHSSGEIAAAYSAGFIDFRTAMAIAYFRGQTAAHLAKNQSTKGGMMAVGTGEDEARELIEQHATSYATVAAVNSPSGVTLSGDAAAIDSLHRAAESQGKFARKLKINMAYHSRHMEEGASAYHEAILQYLEPVHANQKSQDTAPVFVSSVTEEIAQRKQVARASYWVSNLCNPVRFSSAIKTLFSDNDDIKTPNVIVEIGPHSALKGPINQCVEALEGKMSFTYLPSLIRGDDPAPALGNLAVALFTNGVEINLGAVNGTDKHNSRVLQGLPAYAWDKSRSYDWCPRPTKNKLFPGEEFHPLLGRKLPSSTSGEQKYRQVFTLDEFPWIRDHNVGGTTIFPMTGYMSCAIEAARRAHGEKADSFLISEFHVVRSLEIEEEQEVDMFTTLLPATTSTSDEAGDAKAGWSFEVTTYKEPDGWTVHAYGFIEAETQPMTLETPTLKASSFLLGEKDSMIKHEDMTVVYGAGGLKATQYGPTFRNAYYLWEGKGFTILETRLRDLGEELHKAGPRGSNATVDPATLDTWLQGGGPLQRTSDGKKPVQMPNYISQMRLSNSIVDTPGTVMDAVTRLVSYDEKGGRMNISVAVFSKDKNGLTTPVAEWETISFRTLGFADDDEDPAATVPDSWAWDLLPRYDLLTKEERTKQFGLWDYRHDQAQRLEEYDLAAAYYMRQGLQETEQDDHSKLPTHLVRFRNWAKNTVLPSYDSKILDKVDEALLNKVRNTDAQGFMIQLIGEKLGMILRQEIEPLELMLPEGRLTKYYEADVLNARLSEALGSLASNLGDHEPTLRILEIGAGTAGTTKPVMEALSKDRLEPAFESYTFTDISSGFFENAKDKLSSWQDRIEFKKLDITQDPLTQGFEKEEFDLVIAANVLHATSKMNETMSNVRKLLKPAGKCLLLEANYHPPAVLPFSLLPGWWCMEDPEYRTNDIGPMMPVATWDRVLRDVGFSGVDCTVGDSLHVKGPEEHCVGIMSTTRIGAESSKAPVIVTGPFLDDLEIARARTLADKIAEQFSCPTETMPFIEAEDADEAYYVVLDSPENTIMKDMTEEKFMALQNLLTRNTGCLWVLPENGRGETKQIMGLMRTLRIEYEAKNLLLLDETPTEGEDAMAAILKVVESLRDTEPTKTRDQDFTFHNGSVHFPRMMQLRDVKERFAVEKGTSYRTQQGLWAGGRALEMTVEAAGTTESIYWQRTNILEERLAPNEVLIQVEAVGLSQRDLAVIMGNLPWSSPGLDGAGKVVKTGTGVKDLQKGDQVMFLSLDSSAFTTHKKTTRQMVAKIPDGKSVAEAASIPMAYTLAAHALFYSARLVAGESVLIHSAMGAVGQACVVLAQHLGATVYATAGSDSKRKQLQEKFGIPKNRIFSSRAKGLRDAILTQTEGKGIDVIVNSLGGILMKESWKVCAHFGRWVEISKTNITDNTLLPMNKFGGSATFCSTDLKDLFEHKPEALAKVFQDVQDLLQHGVVKPLDPVLSLPLSELSSGLRKIRSGENAGKIVITLGKDETVLAESSLRPSDVQLHADATYIVTGGTKGIGLDLASWLMEHGAGHVVILGRSGADKPAVKQLIQKYEGTKQSVRAIACHVGMKDDVVNALQSIKDLPPVRGVVHSALLLSDKLFETATFEDWETIVYPRVRGANILDEHLPKDLDFFVVLSSFLGDSGNAGQAIYAGTANFYDAFARKRMERGQNSLSIALPVVLDVGYVADNNIADTLRQALGLTLTMADIRTILKSVVGGKPSPFSHNGKCASAKLYLDGKAVGDLPWKYFHPILTKGRLMERSKQGRGRNRKDASGGAATSWTQAADPQEGLTDALVHKVATMTMMEVEEVQPDAPLATFSLDSLVSVELRNWIRRETNVELALPEITQAESLSVLAKTILERRG